MATIQPVVTQLGPKAKKVVWTLPNNTDDAAYYVAPGMSDRSVAVEGSFGGSTVTIEGRNGTTPSVLNDFNNAPLSFTADSGVKQILEVCEGIRPKVTGGTSPSVVVSMIVVD